MLDKFDSARRKFQHRTVLKEEINLHFPALQQFKISNRPETAYSASRYHLCDSTVVKRKIDFSVVLSPKRFKSRMVCLSISKSIIIIFGSSLKIMDNHLPPLKTAKVVIKESIYALRLNYKIHFHYPQYKI